MKTLRAVLYARVSTEDGRQDTETQLRALRDLCAQRGLPVIEECADQVTGDPARRRGDPPGLQRALELLQKRRADVLVIFAADRLVRSAGGLLDLVDRVQQHGGRILSLQDGSDLDTTTDHGQLITFLKGWFARVSLNLTRTRTKAGLERTKAQGTKLGRPRVSLNEEERATIALYLAQGHSRRAVMRILGATRREVMAVQEWTKNGGSEAGGSSERGEGA